MIKISVAQRANEGGVSPQRVRNILHRCKDMSVDEAIEKARELEKDCSGGEPFMGSFIKYHTMSLV